MDSYRMISSVFLVALMAFLVVEKTGGLVGASQESDRKLEAAAAEKTTAGAKPEAAAAAGPAAAPDAAAAPAGAPDAAAAPGAPTTTDTPATPGGDKAAEGDKHAEEKKASAATGPSAKAFGMTAFASSALTCMAMM